MSLRLLFTLLIALVSVLGCQGEIDVDKPDGDASATTNPNLSPNLITAVATTNGTTVNGSKQITLNSSSSFSLLNGTLDTSGMIGYWTFEEGVLTNPVSTSANAVLDLSPSLRHCTVDGGSGGNMTYSNGNRGLAPTFDGVDDYLNCGTAEFLGNETEASVCTWVNFDVALGGGNPDAPLVSKYVSGGAGWTLFGDFDAAIGGSDNTISFVVDGGAGINGRAEGSDELIIPGHWYFVCGTFSGGNYVRLFINGKLNSESTVGIVAQMESNLGTNLKLGEFSSRFIDGRIDEVSAWTRALSPEEIDIIYKRQAPKFTGGFTSEIYNAGAPQTWKTLHVSHYEPYFKEFFQEPDTNYTSGVSSNVLSADQVSRYHFNGALNAAVPAGADAVTEDGGNNINHGTRTDTDASMKYTHGRFNTGIYFDGLEDFINVTNDPSLDFSGNGMTISIWVYPYSQQAAGYRCLIGRSVDFVLCIQSTGGGNELKPSFGGNFNGIQEISSPSTVPLWQWSHVVATYDNAVIRLYINGVEVQSNPVIGSVPFSANDMTIGDVSGSTFFHGIIDELHLFNKALSAPDVLKMYDRGAKRASYQVQFCSDNTCTDDFMGPDGTENTFYTEELSQTQGQASFDLTTNPSASATQYFQFKTFLESENQSSSSVQVNSVILEKQ